MWCFFTFKSTAEGQNLAEESTIILSSAKCVREKLHPKGLLPLKRGLGMTSAKGVGEFFSV